MVLGLSASLLLGDETYEGFAELFRDFQRYPYMEDQFDGHVDGRLPSLFEHLCRYAVRSWSLLIWQLPYRELNLFSRWEGTYWYPFFMF